MDITKLQSLDSRIAGKNGAWKLNQELLATVVNSGSRGKLLQIDGKTYNPPPNALLEPGKSLMLKVVSLHPQIEFALLGTYRNSNKAEPVAATILSAQLVQKTLQANKRSIANLLNFIRTFNLSALQSLPAEALSVLNILKKKLIKSEQLSDASKLMPALHNSGLLLESKLAANENQHKLNPTDIDADLKALLFQILKSLSSQQSPPAQGKCSGNAIAAQGLAIYRDADQKSKNTKTQLMQKVEQVLSRIIVNQNNTLDEFREGNQRWFFELPVNFLSQPQTVPVTIYRDNTNQSELSGEALWGAEFSLELKHSGFILVQLSIANKKVTVSLHSELNKTARFLDTYHDTLRDNLDSCGLTLGAFSSGCINQVSSNV